MSVVKDTTNLRPYKPSGIPVMDESLKIFILRELQAISASNNAILVALKSIEARIVVGGL